MHRGSCTLGQKTLHEGTGYNSLQGLQPCNLGVRVTYEWSWITWLTISSALILYSVTAARSASARLRCSRKFRCAVLSSSLQATPASSAIWGFGKFLEYKFPSYLQKRVIVVLCLSEADLDALTLLTLAGS